MKKIEFTDEEASFLKSVLGNLVENFDKYIRTLILITNELAEKEV